MTDRWRRPGGDRDVGWLHIAVACGLLFLALIGVSFFAPGWGMAPILVVLLLCSLMLIVMARGEGSGGWLGLGKTRRE